MVESRRRDFLASAAVSVGPQRQRSHTRPKILANYALSQLSYTPTLRGHVTHRAHFKTAKICQPRHKTLRSSATSLHLARGAVEEFTVAAAKRSDPRPSFLPESNQRLPGTSVNHFAQHLDFYRAGSEFDKVPGRLGAGIHLQQPRTNDQRFPLAPRHVPGPRFATQILEQSLDERRLDRADADRTAS